MKQLLCVAFIALNFVIIDAMTTEGAEIESCAMKVNMAVSKNMTLVNEIMMYAQELRIDLIMDIVKMEVDMDCTATEIAAMKTFMMQIQPALNIISEVVANFSIAEKANLTKWLTPPINTSALLSFFLMKFKELPSTELNLLKMTLMNITMIFMPDSTSTMTSTSKSDVTTFYNNIMTAAKNGNTTAISAMLDSGTSLPVGWKIPSITPVSMPNMPKMPMP